MKKVNWLVVFTLLLLLLSPFASFAGDEENLILSNYERGVIPEYRIKYSVADKDLYQANNDYISIIINDQTELPVTILPEDILINSVAVQKIRTFQSRGQIDIFVPVDIAAGQTADILIKDSAGIKNPNYTGTYDIDVWSSKVNTVSKFYYIIDRGKISTPKVEVSPAVINRDAEFTCSFKASQSGSLAGGDDSITISFPQEINLPSYIADNTITVNSVGLKSTDITVSENRLVLKVPSGTSVGPEGDVTVKITPAAKIKNPDRKGEYLLYASTSEDPSPIPSEIFTIGETAVSDIKVTVTPASADSESEYEITFKTSPYGALRGGSGIISVTFPSEVKLPSYIYKNSIEVQGILLDTGNVTLKGRTASFILPSNVQVGPNQPVRVTIKNTGIRNPDIPGNYNLRVITSSDQQTVRSENYTIAGGKLITLVIDSVVAYIDGKVIVLDAPPTISDGRTLVPVRFLAETLGARVEWDNNTQEINVTLNDKSIKMTLNSKIAAVNGKPVTLDTVPVVLYGRTLVPIRFITENLGCEVIWDSKSRSVIIKNGE